MNKKREVNINYQKLLIMIEATKHLKSFEKLLLPNGLQIGKKDVKKLVNSLLKKYEDFLDKEQINKLKEI